MENYNYWEICKNKCVMSNMTHFIKNHLKWIYHLNYLVTIKYVFIYKSDLISKNTFINN